MPIHLRTIKFIKRLAEKFCSYVNKTLIVPKKILMLPRLTTIKYLSCILLFTLTFLKTTHAQVDTSKTIQKELGWFNKINIRGYSQIRYNRLLETNENLGCEQCDRSWGKNNGFFMRRMRVIIFGQINKNVYLYVQPDFASSPSSDRLHFAQIRDAYFDVGVDKNNEFRFRIGQSKVPYGFENMQSSQNRLALDRTDGLNSAVSNERDIGVFFYWAPKKKRELFSRLVSSGLKGSGDYGVFALGAYNGQLANSPEANNTQHIVSRISYPIELKKQIVELGVQAYSGKYVIAKTNVTTGVTVNPDYNYLDQRYAATVVWYPQPFGIQAEYNIGKGPEYDKGSNSIVEKKLSGGYVLTNYYINLGKQVLIPFVRYHYYDGGKKHELDARSYTVSESEFGFEWQMNKNFELVAHYTISDRRYEDGKLKNNHQTGNLLRIQAQVNF